MHFTCNYQKFTKFAFWTCLVNLDDSHGAELILFFRPGLKRVYQAWAVVPLSQLYNNEHSSQGWNSIKANPIKCRGKCIKINTICGIFVKFVFIVIWKQVSFRASVLTKKNYLNFDKKKERILNVTKILCWWWWMVDVWEVVHPLIEIRYQSPRWPNMTAYCLPNLTKKMPICVIWPGNRIPGRGLGLFKYYVSVWGGGGHANFMLMLMPLKRRGRFHWWLLKQVQL